MAKCRLSHKLGQDPNSGNMEHDFSKTSFVWSDKHTVKGQSNIRALSGSLATKTSGPDCHLHHVFYCLLVIPRRQHHGMGMLPGLPCFILVHKFTANKHNSFSHFSVLEALAEVRMQAEEERPAHCELKDGVLRNTCKEPNEVNTRKQLCMTLLADSGLCLGSVVKHSQLWT